MSPTASLARSAEVSRTPSRSREQIIENLPGVPEALDRPANDRDQVEGAEFDRYYDPVSLIVEPLGDNRPIGTSPVVVEDTVGRPVGSVSVPPTGPGVLVVSGESDDVVIIPQVSSIVIDITVLDTDGNTVTSFDDPFEICFSSDEHGSGDVCLGFFNSDGEWECEDYCLEDTGDSLCGESRHLTNFALLLDSEAGSSSRCGSSSQDYLYIYLSVASVGAAVCIIILAAVMIEVRIRRNTKSTDSRLTYNSSRHSSMPNTASASAGETSVGSTPLYYDE